MGHIRRVISRVGRGRIVTVDVMRLLWVPFDQPACTDVVQPARRTQTSVNSNCKARSSPCARSGSEVVIKHEDIKGFMPGMTMPFKVKDDALLAGKQPGDLVTATLVVGETQAHLSSLDEDRTRGDRPSRRHRRRRPTS